MLAVELKFYKKMNFFFFFEKKTKNVLFLFCLVRYILFNTELLSCLSVNDIDRDVNNGTLVVVGRW